MEFKKLETNVPVQTLEIGECLKEILTNTADVMADGWNPWMDVPRIIKRSFAEFLVAAKGISEAKVECKERPMLATIGIITPTCQGVDYLLESLKPEQKELALSAMLSREEQIEKIMSSLGN